MAYGIWLSYNNQEEGFIIPVNPGTIEIGDSGQGKTYDVAGLGEINVIKNPKLTEYSFSSFFPVTARGYPFVATNLILQPKQYIEYILKWMSLKRPIRFVFTGDSFDINVAASIEKFDWKEVAGSGGDVEYTLKLKKYEFYSAKKVLINESNEKVTIRKDSAARQNDKEKPETYTLVAGDTLWKVAKKVYDDGSRWGEIQSLNKIKDSDLTSLAVGTVLNLPA